MIRPAAAGLGKLTFKRRGIDCRHLAARRANDELDVGSTESSRCV